MKPTLTPRQAYLHRRALYLCRQHRRLEWRIVEVLQQIDSSKLYRHFAFASLFQYAVHELGLSESVAYSFISVARKARSIPQLGEAVKSEALTVSKASKIVAALDAHNASELVEFAKTHSTREIEFEVARRNPKSRPRERIRPLSEDLAEIKTAVTKADLEIINRAKEIMAQKMGKNCNVAELLVGLAREYVKRHDPVAKARRVEAKVNTSEAINVKPALRISLKAKGKHVVNARDGGRCTFIDGEGRRCTAERWLHVHHLKPVGEGGGNNPENLVTLCSAHHDLVHQLSLPLDGQVSWLREPRAEYSGTRGIRLS